MTSTAANAVASNYFISLAEIEEDKVLGFAIVKHDFVEYTNVGAGVGGGFENTAELKPMKYEQAINGPGAEAWKAEIENEHDRMVKNKVFQEVNVIICLLEPSQLIALRHARRRVIALTEPE